MEHQHTSHAAKSHANHYEKLALMAALSFVSMYILMYAMVDTFANVYNNVNQFYMAGLMSSPMVVIEVLLMSSMYSNRKANALIIVLTILAGIGFFMGIRQQVAVSDTQFLKSMIPHHAAAILMCEQTDLTDPHLKKLCNDIVTNQQAEINQMKAKLTELGN